MPSPVTTPAPAQLWAVAIVGTRAEGLRVAVDNAVVMMWACSRDEALGRGTRLAEKVYPSSQNWHSRDVNVCAADHVTDPDQPIEVRQCPSP